MTGHVGKLCVHHRKKWLLIQGLVLRNGRGAGRCRFCSFAALATVRGGEGGGLWFSVCIRDGSGGFGVCDIIFACVLVWFITLRIEQDSEN